MNWTDVWRWICGLVRFEEAGGGLPPGARERGVVERRIGAKNGSLPDVHGGGSGGANPQAPGRAAGGSRLWKMLPPNRNPG